jgi:hypothetical protein
MATSGTVSTTVFTTRKVIEHAFRKCKIAPQQIVAEHIETAKDLLWLHLSTIASKGIALWAVEKQIVPIYAYVQDIELPVGTVDLLDVNLRQLQRPTGFLYDSSEGDADLAFDGDIDTSCIQITPAGWISVQYASATRLTNFGILAGVTDDWDISIETSQDGITWTTAYTNPAFEAIEGEWTWIDVKGLVPVLYCRLKANGTTVLNVDEFVAGNTPNEIPLALVNTDTYDSQPDKSFPGRPTEYRYDKQRTQPVMNLWPAPGPEYTFYQLITRVQRYIQDVGALTQEIEVPQRWYLAIICELAKNLMYAIPEADLERLPAVVEEAKVQMKIAWDGEGDGSQVQIRVGIGCYTR